MAEFHSDEQREGYLAGLEHEKEGYQARIDAANVNGDKQTAARYANRIEQVDAELARVNGDTPKKSKSKSKSKSQADDGEKSDEGQEPDGSSGDGSDA